MPYDKDGKYYRKPVYSEKDYWKNAKKDSGKEFIKRKEQGKQFQKKEPNQTGNNNELPSGCKKGCLIWLALVGFGVFLLLLAPFFPDKSEPKRNPNLEGSVQDFDVCVKKQKRKGLSTDKCWDML